MRKAKLTKSQAGYKWSQTEESLSVTLPVRNVTRKDIDVLWAEYVLKVNVPTIRYVQIIDFPFPIDFANPQNKVQLTDDSLEVFLIKKDLNVAPWTEIQLSGLSNQELTQRRQKCLDDYYAWQEAERVKTKELTYEMDHEVVRQQMAVDARTRDFIDNSKKAIHDQETEVLQGELDQLEAKNKALTSKAKAFAAQAAESAEAKARRYKSQRNTDIFGDADVASAPRETSRILTTVTAPKPAV